MGTPPRLLIPVLGLMFAAPSMSSPSNAYRWLRRGPLACGVVAAALGASGLAPLAGGPQAPWLAVGSGIALLALGIAVASAGTRRAGAKTLAWLAAFASLGAAALVFEPATSLTHPSTPVAIVAAFIGAGVLATLGGAADLFPEVLGVAALATCLFAMSGHSQEPGRALLDGRLPSVVASIGLAIAAAGLFLLRPRSRLVGILSHAGPSGALVRRHFAVASLAPAALAAIAELGEHAGLWPSSWADPLYVVAITLVLLAVTRLGARATFLAEHEHARVAGERAARAEAERAAARLELQGEALREALCLRDEFLTVAAHELRTPLTVVALNVQALGRHGGPFEARTHRKLHAVRAQLARMERMIDELLDTSRLADGELAVFAEDLDLGEVVRGVTRGRADDLRASGSRLELDLSPAAGAWDRRRLAQVIERVLDNAIKYGRGSPIVIRVAREEDDAVVEIRDHGIGIPPERRSRLFERYGRAVSERNYGGFGLGLWSAKRWVGAMGGRIEVESEVDVGTTVRIALPAQRADVAGRERAAASE